MKQRTSKSFWQNVLRYDVLIVIIIAAIIATVSIIVHYHQGTILAYGDAESHINIAKRVVSGLVPGLGQLGGVWLPLHHLMMIPFVANDFMWRTGIGGAIVSAGCFVAAAAFIYSLAKLLTKKRWIGLIAFVAFAANPNIYYMLATPMSELPLMAFSVGSTYFFIRWTLLREIYYLVIASALVLLASLTRYDAWFLIFIEFVCVLAVALRERWSFRKIEAYSLVFLTLALFGTVLWLSWSTIIFHDPFYFMNSQYSAKSQQLSFMTAGTLLSYHNIAESIKLYGGAVALNAGVGLSIIGVAGLLTYCVLDQSKRFVKLVVVLLLASPFLFNVLSLFLGISVLFVPGFMPKSFNSQIFNVRYGLQMVPSIIIFIALLISTLRPKIVRVLGIAAVLICVVLNTLVFPVTLQDGLTGLSARFPMGVKGVNKEFGNYYDHGYVAFDDFSRAANPVALNIPMNKIIYIGSHPYWEDMEQKPNEYARWIIIRQNDVLYKVFKDSKVLKQDYTAVYSYGDTALYKCTSNCTGWAK